MALFKHANRLKIKTVLGEPHDDFSDNDPLLLASVDGTEGVSQPYAYDLILLRRTRYPHVEPNALINSPAAIGIKISLDHFIEIPVIGVKIGEDEDAYTYVERYGVFSWFENLGPGNVGHLGGSSFVMYQARLVSNFQMLSHEIVYRVFEKMNVVDIIVRVLNSFPTVYYNIKSLIDAQKDPERFPIMDICFQYGESTFNFLSRLMARFGIWYYFDHDPEVGKEKLVLCVGSAQFAPCRVRDRKFNEELASRHLELDQQVLTQNEPSPVSIARFQAHYLSAPNFVRTRNFRPLLPADPVKGEAKVQDYYDLLHEDSAPDGGATSKDPRFQINVFPVEPSDKSKADTDAARRITTEESQVYVFGGQSKNPAFIAAQKFQIIPHPSARQDAGTDDIVFDPFPLHHLHDHADGSTGAPRTYNITFVHFNSFENSFGHSVLKDIGGFLKAFFSPITSIFTGGKGLLDLTLAATAGGLNNYIKSTQQNANQQAYYNQLVGEYGSSSKFPPSVANVKAASNLRFDDYFEAGAVASLTTLVTALGASTSSALSEVMANHKDDYGNSFAALVDGTPMPPPGGAKPRAAGPHRAVVVGPDGIKDTAKGGKTDIWADAIGRVRVRFPWDPGPPKPSQSSVPTQPTWESPDADDAYASDRNTCWVWVSEAWAGRSFGSQFLPRIGQEVLVDFIDGDPDRPIITGRIYNGDNPQSYPNLPFPDPATAQTALTNDDLLDALGSSSFRFTGLKTQSTPQEAKNRYHLLRLDDTVNCEQYLVRSQGRLDVTAFAHSFKTTYGNQNIKVAPGKDKDAKPFGGASYTTVAGEYDLHVGDSRYEQVEKNYELTVKGNTQIDVKGDLTEVIRGKWSHGANEIVLEATQKITLKVGASWVVIDPCGVYITGPMVYVNSGGDPGTRGALKMQDITDATPAEPGDEPIKRLTDCNPSPGGHGARKTHTDQIQPAPTCEQLTGHVDCGDYGSSEAEALMSMEGGASIGPNPGGASRP